MYELGKLPAALRVATLVSCVIPLVGAHAGNLFEGTLDGVSVPKFVEPLVVPPVMPEHGHQVTWQRDEYDEWQYRAVDYYKIAVRQFEQQILPSQGWTDTSGIPIPAGTETTVWSYGSVDKPGTVAEGGSFHYPALTVEAKVNKPDRVKWINDLVDENGNYLPHLLPVDQTLHWANPMRDCRPHTKLGEVPLVTQGMDMTDCVGKSGEPYTGPVPMVAHLHGAHVSPESDGYPEAWWLPKARNLPAGISTHGRLFADIRGTEKTRDSGSNDGAQGYAVYEYANDQAPATLWYHDHSMGMTRTNVYAGPAGFWLIRDKEQEKRLRLPGPAPKNSKYKPNKRYYEIPMVLQDRSFKLDGSLYYPESRARFDGYDGPVMPQSDDGEHMISDIAPMWNPEAFFETIVVNGRTWPYLDVEPRQYRFRMLNGSNSRFFNLVLNAYAQNGDLLGEVPMYQIGGDGGLLPQVIEVKTGFKTALPGNGTIPYDKAAAHHADEAMLMGPAERMDVIVDFAGLPQGTAYVRMENTAPDAPFGGFPIDPTEMADPATTGMVMEFRPVLKLRRRDRSTPVADLQLPSMTPLEADRPTRYLSLNEMESHIVDVFGNRLEEDAPAMAPHSAMLGTYDPETGESSPTMWADPIKTIVDNGGTEEWEVYNLTEDAHPVHLHLVQFQVVERRNEDGSPIDRDGDGVADCEAPCVGANEKGWKDTVLAYPGETTKVIAHFDKDGLYVWHCHILEHEDMEMMLPFCVGEPGKDCPAILFKDDDLPEEFKGLGMKSHDEADPDDEDRDDSHDYDHDRHRKRADDRRHGHGHG